jgi:hypothetical protein
VELSSNNDVVLTGGSGAYAAWDPPGMDSRVYAQGGSDMGDASLTHSTATDQGLGNVNQPFYITTWTVPLDSLSNDLMFNIGLHQATSCGNDQIGMVAAVPVPGAVLLGDIGLSVAGWRLRRKTA